MPRINIIPSNPAKDRTHPDSKLPIQGPGDIVLRLVRKFGLARGMKVYGFMMSLADENGESIEGLMDARTLSEYNMALKECDLVPADLKPKDLGEYTRRWFRVGFKTGMIAAELVNPGGGGDKTQLAD